MHSSTNSNECLLRTEGSERVTPCIRGRDCTQMYKRVRPCIVSAYKPWAAKDKPCRFYSHEQDIKIWQFFFLARFLSCYHIIYNSLNDQSGLCWAIFARFSSPQLQNPNQNKNGTVTISIQNWLHIVLLSIHLIKKHSYLSRTQERLQSCSGTKRPRRGNVGFLHSYAASPFVIGVLWFFALYFQRPPTFPLPWTFLLKQGEKRRMSQEENRWGEAAQFIIFCI